MGFVPCETFGYLGMLGGGLLLAEGEEEDGYVGGGYAADAGGLAEAYGAVAAEFFARLVGEG